MHENFFAINYYVYGIFVRVRIFQAAFPILDAYCLIICSSVSELNDACHTNEMIVYHHTPPSRSDPIFD